MNLIHRLGVFSLLLAVVTPSWAQEPMESIPLPAANTRLTNPATLFAEILGRGLVYTLGYDRVLTQDISVGVGFSSAATERNGVDTDHRAVMIPVYVNLYFQRSPGSIFFTGGADVIVNSGKVKNDEAATSSVQFTRDALMPVFGAGWEYRADGGFLFRVTGYGIAGDQVKPWMGFTFGLGF